jgi:hypothetical protein
MASIDKLLSKLGAAVKNPRQQWVNNNNYLLHNIF